MILLIHTHKTRARSGDSDTSPRYRCTFSSNCGSSESLIKFLHAVRLDVEALPNAMHHGAGNAKMTSQHTHTPRAFPRRFCLQRGWNIKGRAIRMRQAMPNDITDTFQHGQRTSRSLF